MKGFVSGSAYAVLIQPRKHVSFIDRAQGPGPNRQHGRDRIKIWNRSASKDLHAGDEIGIDFLSEMCCVPYPGVEIMACCLRI